MTNLKNTFENLIFNVYVTEDLFLDDDIDPDACIYVYGHAQKYYGKL